MPGKEKVSGREAGKNRRYEINFLAPRAYRSTLPYPVTAGGQSKQHGQVRRQRLAQRNHIGQRLIPKCHVEISTRESRFGCAWRGSQSPNQTLDSLGNDIRIEAAFVQGSIGMWQQVSEVVTIQLNASVRAK
jgi:hypothetical protein